MLIYYHCNTSESRKLIHCEHSVKSILNGFNREQHEEMHAPGIFRFYRLSSLPAEPRSPEAIPSFQQHPTATPCLSPLSALTRLLPTTHGQGPFLQARSCTITWTPSWCRDHTLPELHGCPRGPADFSPSSQRLSSVRDPALLPFWHRF